MGEKIKIWFKSRYEGTIFSEAGRMISSVWSRNKFIIILEVIAVMIGTVYATGAIIIAAMNLFGHG